VRASFTASMNSGADASTRSVRLMTAVGNTSWNPYARRIERRGSETMIGRYPSAVTVPAPATTTSARSRNAAKIRLSPGVCRPADLPAAWAAPSTEATKLTRRPPGSSQSAA
jgi:hypothetical protein